MVIVLISVVIIYFNDNAYLRMYIIDYFEKRLDNILINFNDAGDMNDAQN